MRVPLQWLYEYCQPQDTAAELAQRLAATGTEVDRILKHGITEPEGFVVGRVISTEQHPNADRLRVCQVDLGEETPAHIVCGAPNVAEGQTVAVAKPGAKLPDGTKLKKAKLRGVESFGMILAEDEIGLGAGHAGIMVLDDGYQPGTPLADVLPLGTDVLELEITPNRPDCLGMYGVAREVYATTGAPLSAPPWESELANIESQLHDEIDGVSVTVEASDLCPRFTALAYDNVSIGESPLWLKARLMAAGQRPINNVVDITNYVMLLTGQPLHAFDLDKIVGGKLTVAAAAEGQEITTLDDVTRKLSAGTVLIHDEAGPVAIAGVMGGARCEVDTQTTAVLLEVASWDGAAINKTSSQLGLRSEASARFEKGLAPQQTLFAQAVAKQLMVELCGATLRPGGIDIGEVSAQQPKLLLRTQAVERIVGVAIPVGEQQQILKRLDFVTAAHADGLTVEVPPLRQRDITREIDLVEEVARIYGFDRVPAQLPARRSAVGRLPRAGILQRKALDLLVQRGFHEMVGWGFASPQTNTAFGLGAQDAVVLTNPMSQDQSQLRGTLIQSLLAAAKHNASHGAGKINLVENGTVFSRGAATTSDGVIDESQRLAAITAYQQANLFGGAPWAVQAPVFFGLKAILGSLFESLHLKWSFKQVTDVDGFPWLHPGRAAQVFCAEKAVGWFGELHPKVAESWGLYQYEVAAFELDLASLLQAVPETVLYRAVPSVPDVHEDLAVIFAEDVVASDVQALVKKAAGSILKSVSVFDYYQGEHVSVGKVSLGLRLIFNAGDRTLTNEEITSVREKILQALANELGGELRQ